MHLEALLSQFQERVAAAASLGDDHTREIAARLATAVTPAVRLAMLDAVSAAADEATAALLDHPGSPAVSVAMDGDDIRVDVRAVERPPVASGEPADPAAGEPSARVSLRLTEALKSEIDAAATRDGVSVNTWLVRAAQAALQPNPFAQLGAGFARFGGLAGGHGFGSDPSSGRHDQHLSGWIDG